ncbi:hypothetical protein CPC16_009471, partial [Podila verticillata]
MSHSSRSDQSQSQPQGDLISNDPAMQQIISERNSLRAQNEQLWKIIEKQRVIIQNLQKDVSKISAERDLLRSSSSGQESGNNSNNSHHQPPQQSNYTNPSGYQPTTQYQPSLHSKRSMERGDRRAQENHGTSEPTSFDKEPELASSFNPNASFASTISTSDYRPAQHEQQQPHHHQQPHPPSRHPHHHHHEQLHSGAPLTPSSNYDTEYDLSKNDIRIDESGPYPNYDHGPYPSQPENEDPRQDYYDADVATRSQGSTVERDARMPAPRSDSTPALN